MLNQFLSKGRSIRILFVPFDIIGKLVKNHILTRHFFLTQIINVLTNLQHLSKFIISYSLVILHRYLRIYLKLLLLGNSFCYYKVSFILILFFYYLRTIVLGRNSPTEYNFYKIIKFILYCYFIFDL